MIKTIMAAPLELAPLDKQIRQHGGEGFNYKVKVTRVENSFACLQEFDTPEGRKCLITRNTFQVGLIDDFRVMYYGDSGEYVLMEVKEIDGNKVSFIKSLGTSFDELETRIKEYWPDRVVFNLTDPMSVIGADYG